MKKVINIILIFLFSITVFIPSYAEKNGEKNLYYILTPYSCLGASSIALGKNRNDINDAYIYSSARFTKECLDKLKLIFDNIYICGKDENELNKKFDNYDNYYSANSYFAPNKKYYHYEDGAAEYLATASPDYFCNTKLLKKLYLTFPKYRCKDLQQIPAEQFNRDNFLKAIEILYGKNKSNKKILYCLELFSDIDIKKSHKIIKELTKYKNEVVIKNHPRDTRQYFFPEGMTQVDRHVAFESLCYNFDGIIISNSSSVLHTAKFISPKSTVICTKFLGDSEENASSLYDNYISMLKNIGVLFPKSIEELNTIIKNNITE